MKTNRLPPILPRGAEPAPTVTLVDVALFGVGLVFFLGIACLFGAYAGVLAEFWAQ